MQGRRQANVLIGLQQQCLAWHLETAKLSPMPRVAKSIELSTKPGKLVGTHRLQSRQNLPTLRLSHIDIDHIDVPDPAFIGTFCHPATHLRIRTAIYLWELARPQYRPDRQDSPATGAMNVSSKWPETVDLRMSNQCIFRVRS